jgi:hypothetical protein
MQGIFSRKSISLKSQESQRRTIVPEKERLFTEKDRSQKSTICSKK